MSDGPGIEPDMEDRLAVGFFVLLVLAVIGFCGALIYEGVQTHGAWGLVAEAVTFIGLALALLVGVLVVVFVFGYLLVDIPMKVKGWFDE